MGLFPYCPPLWICFRRNINTILEGIYLLLLRSPKFYATIFFISIFFFSFLIVLSWADLSFVFPAKSLVYVVSTLGAKWILKETVPLQRWGGIFLVCLGVALISLP